MGAAYRWLACCALLLTAAQAQSAVELKVIATDPAPDALLARQQPFFVRFELKSAQPAMVSVSGLFKGSPVIDSGGSSAPTALPAGGGIGVVNLFYWGEKPTRIDEVRLNVVAGGSAIGEYAFPVTLTWLTDDPVPREPAPWVKEWQRAQPSSGGQKSSGTPPSTFGMPGASAWIGLAIAAALLAVAIGRLRWRRRASSNDQPGEQ